MLCCSLQAKNPKHEEKNRENYNLISSTLPAKTPSSLLFHQDLAQQLTNVVISIRNLQKNRLIGECHIWQDSYTWTLTGRC
jgi:hypothetical protein